MEIGSNASAIASELYVQLTAGGTAAGLFKSFI